MDEEMLNETLPEEDLTEEYDDLTEEEEEEEEVPELEAPRFAVNTVLNAERQLEASKAISPKITRIFSILMIVLAAAGAAALFWMYFARGGRKNLFMAIFALLLSGYILYSYLAMPKKALMQWEARLYKDFGTAELHLLTEFYDKAMAQTLQETGNLTTEGYSAIKEFKETEHLFLLRHSAQQWFFLEKTGFTVGTADEFRTFITERIGG